ncbi:hypothetical protein B0H21DRAFT_781332 [Amylocystis lapponica]|nr:hypothetical protein B0H21DRAFT_781332 [Amylocystis lapponica]
MSSFAALMALSATQTRQSDAAVQSALAERQRKEAQKRKATEERERRERDIEAKLRLRRLEETQREEERQQRLERERAAKERELARHEEEQRNALRYGPKKARDAHGYPVSGAAVPRRRSADDDDAVGNALTREEKRRRRMEADMRVGARTVRRAAGAGYSKAGGRLPGGAVNITVTAPESLKDGDGLLSVRERLLMEPAKLIKLNTVKRDTRTVAEVIADVEQRKNRVLAGDEARDFSDWFGKAKKKADGSAATSRDHTPAATQTTANGFSAAKSASGSASPATPSPGLPRASGSHRPSATLSAPISKASSSQRARTPGAAKPTASTSRTSEKSASSSGASKPSVSGKAAVPPVRGNAPAGKKRPRSPSTSVSPPPAKRRAAPSAQSSISAEIWKMFGKDRSTYIERDVMSDDEDMEADALSVEKEELRSARLARKEDETALEEERRHEEEKRRRRREKELREKRA